MASDCDRCRHFRLIGKLMQSIIPPIGLKMNAKRKLLTIRFGWLKSLFDGFLSFTCTSKSLAEWLCLITKKKRKQRRKKNRRKSTKRSQCVERMIAQRNVESETSRIHFFVSSSFDWIVKTPFDFFPVHVLFMSCNCV